MSSSHTPKPETPLRNLLPGHLSTLLAKHDIHTIEELHSTYPHELLKIRGIGASRLKQIEAALYAGDPLVPVHSLSPAQHVKGSSLNGVLSPKTVRSLARAGIMTFEQLREAGPERLLRIEGLGIQKLQEIESAFFAAKLREV